MDNLRRAWHYLLAEPFMWIFYCFFQPSRLVREFDKEPLLQRTRPMLRLAVPMFLLSYPFAFIGQLLLFAFHISNHFDINSILLLAAFGITIGIVIGISVGIVVGISFGITVSVAFGVAFGIALGIAIGIVGGIKIGIAFGIAFSITGSIIVGIIGGFSFGWVGAIVASIMFGIGGSIGLSLLGAVVFGNAGGMLGDITFSIAFDIAAGTIVGIAFGVAFGITFNCANGFSSIIVPDNAASSPSIHPFDIAFGIAVSSIFSIASNCIGYSSLSIITGSIPFGIVISIIFSIAVGTSFGITFGIVFGIVFGISFGFSFIIAYLAGLYHLPFYSISSGTFLLLVCIASYVIRKNPQQVFTILHHSPLYWDKCLYMPLPFLKYILFKVMEEDDIATLTEIAFIAAERPLQLWAARAVSLEITMRYLERCKNLTSITEVAQCLHRIFPPQTIQQSLPLECLYNACQRATQAKKPIGRLERIEALEEMKNHLSKISPDIIKDQKLKQRLSDIIKIWLDDARKEQKKLNSGFSERGSIINPYKPGQLLKSSDTLFVGRHDLAQQLEVTLSRGDRRPTFMLNGERRMGKSTTLIHLPVLLGFRYLPIFCDLQNPGILSTSATFLGIIAKEIHTVTNARGIQIKPLTYELLKEARKDGDAAVYHKFDRWLDNAEQILVQEDRTLLLAFDEFEKLDEERPDRQLHLPTLLDWFRNVIQHRSRLALLFSGVHTIGEMGTATGVNWSGYFVNVQMLHVGFLKAEEARQLITQPVPNYPSDAIFGEGVVDNIIATTGCHPFLVQAVCSALIDNLNVEQRERAEMDDIEQAVQQVLEAWGDTYFRDLWYRTDEEQRACLEAVLKLGRAALSEIIQESGLDERKAKRMLEIVCRRDLVRRNVDNTYEITAPIFKAWVERSLYS